MAGAMQSLCSHLRKCVSRFFHSMSIVLVLALSRSCRAPVDYMLCIPVEYRFHADELIKHCAPDKNQAILRII